MNWKNIIIGVGTAVVFSVFYILGVFGGLERQVYDFFLRFRADRNRLNEVVFLNVDDPAIAYNGVFPWPRSIMADSLLRLKEYGARAAIFDIEYIDKGPPGVDVIYLNSGLPADFERSFSEINSAAGDIFSAIRQGRLSRNNVDEIARGFHRLINEEKDNLFSRAQSVARDNDLYLFQASALFGRSWITLNLREDATDGEQAERRPMAQELFSYPITAAPHTNAGHFTDVLPPLPGLMYTAEGAGYTNVEVDNDGIRRRIRLAQNVQDYWYLQLAFSPLINYLGEPEIELNNRRLLMKGAKLPGGTIKDISIPLDGDAMMLLDWPKKDYAGSYEHLSFINFSLLEDIEAELEKYVRALGEAQINFFGQYDHSLLDLPFIIEEINLLFDGVRELKTAALETCSDSLFADYLSYRNKAHNHIRAILNMRINAKVNALIPAMTRAAPRNAEAILSEAEYIGTIYEYLRISMDNYEEVSSVIENAVKNKFCIMGRSDTGSTDIGSNPFHAKYINVGTHGVVLDMILSQVFITLIRAPWLILFTVALVSAFFIVSIKFSPVPRAALGLAATVLIIAASILVFRYSGIFFDPLLTVFAMITAIILREIISYADSEREKQFIRKAFSTYVSDEVVKEIISDPAKLQLGGTKRHMSAIFTDVQNFSTISEQLEPENLVSLLNRYLTLMSDAVLEEKGTIDKYEGDAIIAFFGAPIPAADHAIRACSSAIAIKRIEIDLNEKILKEKASPLPLFTRIGINTGSMVAGNMGTSKKMDYTIMGNAVNLASRLEGVNKQYGTWIIASDDTIRETEGRFLTRKLDMVRVVGISEPVRLHEVIETMENAAADKKKMVEIFHQALNLFEERKWKEAAAGFTEALSIENGDAPSTKYLERCNAYMINPPDADWDSVYNIMEK